MSVQRITLVLGVFYVAIGVLGFVPGITSNGLLLGIFAVNALHNIPHLAIGAALIWGSMSASVTMVNKIMAVVFAVLVVASFIVLQHRGAAKNPREAAKETPVRYGTARVTDDVHVVSYKSTAGFTLTVVLNFKDKRMAGFASNEKDWFQQQGTFEVVSTS